MLVGDITITKERLQIVDFSVPVQPANIVLFMKKPTEKDINIFSFIMPLSNNVWIAVLASLLLGEKIIKIFKS